MNNKNILLITILLASLLSCHTRQAEKQPAAALPAKQSKQDTTGITAQPGKQEVSASPDTTSSDYLVSLLKDEKPLNDYWTAKFKALDLFALPLDSTEHLAVVRDWTINDSVSAIIISHGTGTGYDELLLTIKNKKDIISNVRISDQADRDGSPYYYMEYKQLTDRKIKCLKHKVTGTDGGDDDKDRIISTENWSIQDNGKVIKR